MTSITSMLVITSKPVLMQRILDYVGSGYGRFAQGTVASGRLERFANKMVLNYHVDADKHQRARRKQVGLGNAILLLYRAGVDHIDWWLLVSPGDHPAATAEKLLSIKNMMVFGFHLTHETRRDKDKPVATWGMTSDCYQGWRNTVVGAVRSKNVYQMTVTLSELYRLPGFSGIRRRIGQLAVLYRAEVMRHGLSKVAPTTPKRLGYVRRLKTTGLTIRQVVTNQKAA